MARQGAQSAGAAAQLSELAQLYGIDTAYTDAGGKQRAVGSASLLRVLQILGAPVQGAGDVAEALQARRQEPWRRGIDPVTVAWDGQLSLRLRIPARRGAAALQATLHLETGDQSRQELRDAERASGAAVDFGDVAYEEKSFPWPQRVPWGCHRLTIELGQEMRETFVISAPSRAYLPQGLDRERPWGVFLPLYALHSQTSWGAGDFADLRRLLGWVRDQGGGIVATLPVLAAFLDKPFEPSPYSPVSRLFWNEFYIDVAAAPELQTCPAAQRFLASAEFTRERAALQALPLVDYRRQMALKRKVLEELARTFFSQSGSRRDAFESFRQERPRLDDYAQFRAAGERLQRPWPAWPAPQRDGTLQPGDFDEEARRYHLYVQWLADEQLGTLAKEARAAGPGLYLDLPLGVHGDGYDVWRERGSFAIEASGGCPPDLVFPKGQNWGFPPLHPERMRQGGYRYVRAFVHHQMKHAGMLRIDHMPVFHRLWWVPQGMEASEGVYVRYPADELYALFSLESHRHRTLLVGEDLGTVPPEVPESMARHDVQRMYVLQYALTPDPKTAVAPPPAGSIASLNTHDMPPFTAFLAGRDVPERFELGLSGGQDPAVEMQSRAELVDALRRFMQTATGAKSGSDAELLRACLLHLAGSEARLFLVNLEDLWLESHAQNIPSSGARHPNWQRKARYAFEDFDNVPELRAVLRQVAAVRQA